MSSEPRVLYAVLNWGLGHATRSIPVIYNLFEVGFQPVIASDGLALTMLKKRFPRAEFISLRALNLHYSSGTSQLLKLAAQTPKVLAWYQKERRQVKKLLADNSFSGIISDNRPTVFSEKIPSVYITHQLHVEAGVASPLATALHHASYKEYNRIWVPDFAKSPGLSGALGHPANPDQKVSYIGPLSDLEKWEGNTTHRLGIVLSGPEPQRSLLENELINQLKNEDNVKLVRGTNKPPEKSPPETWQIHNLGGRETIAEVYNTCEILISRCGYSTLMDLAAFPKPAILIPTPGQTEQEYLARLEVHRSKFAIQNQNQLNVEKGTKLAVEKFNSSQPNKNEVNWEQLFSLFKGE